MQLADEHLHHQVALVLPQQAVIDEDAGQLVADRAMDQGGCDRGVHSSGQAEDDFLIANLAPDRLDRFCHVIAHDPVGARGADRQHEAFQDGAALPGVGDFRMELNGIKTARLVGHAGDGATGGRRHQLESGRQFGDLVAVAHPDIEQAVALGSGDVGDAVQQAGVAVGPYRSGTELAFVMPLDLATELVGHRLHSIADAQDWNPKLEHQRRRLVGGVIVDAGMATGEDHAPQQPVGGVFTKPRIADVAGMDFAKDMGFANPARNQLRDLGAEIENQDFLVLHQSAPWVSAGVD